MDLIRDDNYMQAGIADLTACLNEEFLCKSVTERASKSNIAMEAGSIFFDDLNDIDDNFFESSATHADTLKGITAEKLRKLWWVSVKTFSAIVGERRC